MKNLKLVIVCILMVSLFSCQEKMVTIPIFEPPVTDKIVLIEEMTGVKCSQCPAGSVILQELIAQYDGNLIGVAIHGPLLAEPIEGDSRYDFRVDHAIDLETYYAIQGKPSAVIDRVRFFLDEGFDDISYITPSTWDGFIKQEFERDQEMFVTPVVTFDPETRIANITVTAKALEDISGDFSLSVMIAESHILDAQFLPSSTDLEYEHNHVLRDMATSTFGDAWFTSLGADETITKEFTYTVPDEENGLWKAQDIEIIAFVENVSTDDGRVMQAGKTYLID